MRPLRPLMLSLAQELGADVEYARPLDNRRYLTGVEIGLFVAVGVVVRFMDGYFDGLIKKQGEKLGEEHAKTIGRKIRRLRDRISPRQEHTATEAVAVTQEVEQDLAQVLEEMLRLLKEKGFHSVAEDRSALTSDISAFLVEQGFPPEVAAERAPSLIVPIEKFLAKEQAVQA